MTIFLSYVEEDKSYKEALLKHLVFTIRNNNITVADKGNMPFDTTQGVFVKTQIQYADIALLFISRDYLSSLEILDEELPLLLQEREKNNLRLIPIQIRPFDLTETPLYDFARLPRNGIPIENQNNQDAAWTAIAKELRTVFTNTTPRPKPSIQAESETSISSINTSAIDESELEAIRDLIENNDIAQALKRLGFIAQERQDKELQSTISNLKFRFAKLIQNSAAGILKQEDEDLENNRIAKHLIQLIDLL